MSKLFGSVTLVDHMGNDASVVRAARVSHGQDTLGQEVTARDEKLIRYLLRNAHWSPFEHTSITFLVSAPIFVARQWMRHRSWSFNEVSGRYKELDLDFYYPYSWRKQSKINKQASEGTFSDDENDLFSQMAMESYSVAAQTYRKLLESGVARELARMVLPVSLMTEFYATANVRSILHFLALRDDPHSQVEIQVLSRLVGDITREFFPVTMWEWEEMQRES